MRRVVYLLLSIHNAHGLVAGIISTDRDLQQCPPGLTNGVCALDNLKSLSGYNACVDECVAATCCQPQDGEVSCMFSCGSICFSYMDCTNLLELEAPFDDSTTYTTTYSPSSSSSGSSSSALSDDYQTTSPTTSPSSISATDTLSNTLDAQQCPPGLSEGICDAAKLQDTSGYEACAIECVAATCCQPNDGQPSCMSTCGEQCMLYMDCMGLSSVEPPPNFSIDALAHEGGMSHETSPSPPTSSASETKISKGDTLSVDYYEGFNVNFLIHKNDAEKLMPYSQFTPLLLDGTHIKSTNEDEVSWRTRGLRGESTNNTNANTSTTTSALGYYISLYAAKIGVEINGEHHRVGRADIFTYTTDPNGKLSLLIVGCYMEIPKILQELGDVGTEHYTKLITDLAPDSRTGKEAYPHFLVEVFNFTKNGLIMSGGDLKEDESIVLDVTSCDGSVASFTKQFVNANSIAWRSPIDKNINFFNQDFIDVSVQAYKVDDSCESAQQIGHLRKQIPSSAQLENIEAYGSSDEGIVWKYDDVTNTEGTPFLTYNQKQDAIELKQQVFSDIWQARSTAIKSGEADTVISLVQGENSVFLIWELSLEAVAILSDKLNLADKGINIVPISVAKGEAAKYILALNVYHSEISGDINGKATRCEWSTYVTEVDDSSIPYYMVIEAGSSTATIDPVNGNEEATVASLSRDGDVVTLVAGALAATIHLGSDSLVIDRDWVYANGRVYWTNGVYDEVYFDSSLVNARPKLSSSYTIEVTDEFEWAELLGDNDPIHAFVYEDANTYLVCPWCGNMKETNPLYNEIKLPIFGSMAQLYSSLIKSGEQPLLDVIVYGNHSILPRIHVNYEIPADSVEEFTRLLSLPPGLSLAPMKFTDSSPSKYMLTLAVFHESFTFDYELSPPWNKAVWTTYIQDETSHIYLNEYHVVLSQVGMDVVAGLKEGADLFDVSYTDNNTVEIAVEDNNVSLNITVPKPSAPANLIGLSDEWIDAHDRVYWVKGVFDKLYINDQLSEAKVSMIDASKLKIVQNTPWLHMIEEEPFEAFYFHDDVAFVSLPWENIEEVI